MEHRFVLFAGSSHKELADEIARLLKVSLGKVLIEAFPDGEIGVQILEKVRGKDAFVIQSPVRDPNYYLMELLIIVDALKRASARSIVAVMPYYPYARQDRKDKGRVPITAKLVADLLEKAGVTRLLTMDLHTEQIQGFFNIPVDHLYGRSLIEEELKKLSLKNCVVVSPDIGSNRMARKYAEDLKLDLAMIDKRRVSANRVEVYALVGDVKGKKVLLVDDICSTGETLRIAARVCKKKGAKSVIAAVTHDLQIGSKDLEEVDQLVVANTIPSATKLPTKVKTVSVAPLFAGAIDCVVSSKSLSALFKS